MRIRHLHSINDCQFRMNILFFFTTFSLVYLFIAKQICIQRVMFVSIVPKSLRRRTGSRYHLSFVYALCNFLFVNLYRNTLGVNNTENDITMRFLSSLAGICLNATTFIIEFSLYNTQLSGNIFEYCHKIIRVQK